MKRELNVYEGIENGMADREKNVARLEGVSVSWMWADFVVHR